MNKIGKKENIQQKKSARPAPVVYVEVGDKQVYCPMQPGRKNRKGLKLAALSAAVVIAALGCGYAGISYYYTDKFFAGTTINGMDCSGKTSYEVEQAMAERIGEYSLQVESINLNPEMIDGKEIHYRYLSDGDVLKLLKQQKPYQWYKGYLTPATYTVSENVTYDKKLLQEQVMQLECAKEENQIAPENAYVAFTDTQFEVIPETKGSTLDVKQTYRILGEALSNQQPSVNLGEIPGAYMKPEITQDDPGLQQVLDACNNYTKSQITYTFGDESVTLDGSVIKDWLQFDEKGQLLENDTAFHEAIKAYVANLAEQYNTVGTTREFYTTSGRVVYVHGSAYGWKIDQEAEAAQLAEDIRTGAKIEREPVYSMRANSRGNNDLGNTYIEVDLSAQHMYYYKNGSIIMDSPIVSGNMSYSDRITPEGIFTLYYKKSPDVLRGAMRADGSYEYEQPVSYWMPFNGGIGFHDANWQPYFGGDRYLYGGSHGCINMPPSNAAVLYGIIETGVPIICFY